MPQLFKDVANDAQTGEKSAVRALQAWQYLIGKASNRQTAQYDDLRKLMEYTDNRPLTAPLACIMWYCEQNGLPPLTIIVVNRAGVPGDGFTADALKDFHKRREDVFDYPWYRMVPPTVGEFRQAYQTGYRDAAPEARERGEPLNPFTGKPLRESAPTEPKVDIPAAGELPLTNEKRDLPISAMD